MKVALKCPECGYRKVYDGRGACRCGVYLVHHFDGSFVITRKTYRIEDGDKATLLAEAPSWAKADG